MLTGVVIGQPKKTELFTVKCTTLCQADRSPRMCLLSMKHMANSARQPLLLWMTYWTWFECYQCMAWCLSCTLQRFWKGTNLTIYHCIVNRKALWNKMCNRLGALRAIRHSNKDCPIGSTKDTPHTKQFACNNLIGKVTCKPLGTGGVADKKKYLPSFHHHLQSQRKD